MRMILLLICMATLALAEVHPGLKNAIDNGDYKTAKNLKEKMHVDGFYLPASLSVEDAEYIYGPLTDYKWIMNLDKGKNCLLDERSSCSPEFSDRYITEVCQGTTSLEDSICLQWMNEFAQISKLEQMRNSLCQSKETIKKCSLYVSKVPYDNQYTILKELEEKNLLEFTSVVEIDTTVEEAIPKKECLDKWNQAYSAIKSSIEYDSKLGSFRNPESRGYFGESIICFFDGTRKKARKCIGYLDELSKEMKKGCNSGEIKKDVKKKIKVSRHRSPFKDVLKELLWIKYWYAMDDLYLKEIMFAKRYLNLSEDDYAERIANMYSRDSDLNLSELKYFCILFPSLDEKISKDYGVNLFSCSKILSDYPNYLGEKCNVNDSVRTKYFPLTLYGEGKDSLICDLNTAKYRLFTKIDSALGLCYKEREGRKKMGFVCRNGSWIALNEYDTKGLKFEKGTIAKSERDSSLLYFKDFRDDRIYRATKIGNQIWMAENLKYEPRESIYRCKTGWGDCVTECYEHKDINCEFFGRYYTWSLAMDSIGKFSTNGSGCGYNGICSPTYPVRGICPEGWHLPDTTEWRIFIESIGNDPKSIQSIKFWDNATDTFKFGAIPHGYYDSDYKHSFNAKEFNYVEDNAYFWSANNKYEGYYANGAYLFYLSSDEAFIPRKPSSMRFGYTVRCVKDSEN